MKRTQPQTGVFQYLSADNSYGVFVDCRGKTALWRAFSFDSNNHMVVLAEGSHLDAKNPDVVAKHAAKAGAEKLVAMSQNSVRALAQPITRDANDGISDIISLLKADRAQNDPIGAVLDLLQNA